MVTITERAEWVEQIRQIEANDPVQGGENGIDNIPTNNWQIGRLI